VGQQSQPWKKTTVYVHAYGGSRHFGRKFPVSPSALIFRGIQPPVVRNRLSVTVAESKFSGRYAWNPIGASWGHGYVGAFYASHAGEGTTFCSINRSRPWTRFADIPGRPYKIALTAPESPQSNAAPEDEEFCSGKGTRCVWRATRAFRLVKNSQSMIGLPLSST
jgi:hypothetical protein